MSILDRDFKCPKCGGWLEQTYGSQFICDTCDFEWDALAEPEEESPGGDNDV